MRGLLKVPYIFVRSIVVNTPSTATLIKVFKCFSFTKPRKDDSYGASPSPITRPHCNARRLRGNAIGNRHS